MSKMTTQQLQDAVKRLSLNVQIQKISRDTVSTGWNEMNRIMNRFGDINNWVNTSTKNLDTINSIIKFIDDMTK